MSRLPMPDMPECSVVVPTHERLPFLEQALASALAQRDVDLEVIIVENGSTDGTPAYLDRVRDPRVRIVAFDRALGQGPAINVGLKEARGEWVGVLHDDDMWAPTKLRSQLDAADSTGADWVYTGCVYIDAVGRVIGGRPPSLPHDVSKDLLRYNAVPGGFSDVIWRVGVLDGDGLVDEQLVHAVDWDVNLRLLRHGAPAVVSEPLVAYRQHGGNSSTYRWNYWSEHPYIERKFSDLLGGRHIDMAHAHRNNASEAVRGGRRVEAFVHYAWAVGRGDLGSLLRMGGALAPRMALGILRRRMLGDTAWMRRAEIWLEALRSETGNRASVGNASRRDRPRAGQGCSQLAGGSECE